MTQCKFPVNNVATLTGIVTACFWLCFQTFIIKLIGDYVLGKIVSPKGVLTAKIRHIGKVFGVISFRMFQSGVSGENSRYHLTSLNPYNTMYLLMSALGLLRTRFKTYFGLKGT